MPRKERFQSSPCPKAGRNLRVRGELLFGLHVSILALPRDRARPVRVDPVDLRVAVSILAPSEDRARPAYASRRPWTEDVSILALPEGRARRIPLAGRCRGSRCFNPRPARRQGATHGHQWRRAHAAVSIPAPPEDRAQHRHRHAWALKAVVSIPAPPEDRAQHDDPANLRALCQFQSPPRPKTGRNHRVRREIVAPVRRFQSPPRPKTGRDAMGCDIHAMIEVSFNPRPARRQGATGDRGVEDRLIRAFQSSPCPKTGRDTRPLRALTSEVLFQSSPCPKTGRDRSARRLSPRSYLVSILALPEDRARHTSI